MMPIFRLFHFGPLIALFIIFVCYVASVIDSMIWFMPTHNSVSGKINILVLTIWLVLILGNFFRAIFIGPGYVPKNWKPEKESDKKFLQFCQICQSYKPPRAHHCRVCKRCILKMDHHCPWINNCCGHYNHTNFVLFVFFAPVGCLHAFIVFAGTLWGQLFYRSEYIRSAHRPIIFSINAFFMTVIAAGLAFGTIVAVSILFFHQAKIVFLNATSIEQWIIEKAEYRKKRDGNNFQYPYNYGKLENISQVINWRCRPVGDGYKWQVIKGCNQYTLTVEQLQQKQEKRDRLVLFEVIKAYSGSWVPLQHGCCTCLHPPCSDEPRIHASPGEKIMVSRANKYWMYGDKVLALEKVKAGVRERGWFPAECASKVKIEKGTGDNNSTMTSKVNRFNSEKKKTV